MAEVGVDKAPRALPLGRAIRTLRARTTAEQRERRLGVAFVLPALVLFLVVIIYPVVFGISRAFFDVNRVTLEATYVGLENFRAILSGLSSAFFTAARHGLVFAVGTTALQVLVGVVVALMLNRRFAGRALARGLMIFPYMVPMVVAVMVWKWMLNDVRGIVNFGLMEAGIVDQPIVWFGPDWAMESVIMIGAWRYFPFIILIVLARLQSIPQSLYDAAKVDGASSWSQFWNVTLPQLRGVLAVTVMLRLVWEFNDFDLIGLTTGGGPAGATETLPVRIYNEAFFGAGLGHAAALATVMLVLVLAFFALFYYRWAKDE